MRLQTFLVPVTLLTSVLSFRPNVLTFDPRQVPCNGSHDWSEWNQNCCGACPPSTTCTAGEEGCTSTMITLSVIWSQIMTTTTTTSVGQTIYTQETSYASTGTGCHLSASNSQSSVLGAVTPASSETQSMTPRSSNTCPANTITQGSASSSPSSPPDFHTTGVSSSIVSTEDSTWEESSGTAVTNTPLDTSVPANSSSSAPTETGSKHSTATSTGSMGSSSASSSPAHHSTTTSTTSFTGSSGAERPLLTLAAMGLILSSMVIQALLL